MIPLVRRALPVLLVASCLLAPPLASRASAAPELAARAVSPDEIGRPDPGARAARLAGLVPSLLAPSPVGEPRDATFHDAPTMIGPDPRLLEEVFGRAVPAPPGPEAVTLRSSFGDTASEDLRTLLGRGERWHLVRFGASATAREIDGRLGAYGQFPYLVRDPAVVGPAFEETPHLASLGFNARLGGLEAGVDYRAQGKRLERVLQGPPQARDREGTELWVAQRVGALRLRLSQSELTDNVDQNLLLPRTTRSQTAATAEVTTPLGPVLGLTYATGDSERVWLAHPAGARAPERQSFQSLTGSVYQVGSWWSAAAASTYTEARDPGRDAADVVMTYSSVSASLRLTQTVALTSSIGAGRDRYLNAGDAWESGTGALTLSWSPTASRWYTWLSTTYSASRNDERTSDARGTSVNGGVSCSLGRALGGQGALALEVGYDRYMDAAVPRSTTQGAYGFVLFKITRF